MQSTKFRKWPGHRAAISGRRSAAFLPPRFYFSCDQVFPRLPLPDQREFIPANERFCREWA